ncbi:MAG: hypothetical protein JHD16_13895 [Solirubrobacteraceae bacterium]|nr:hypothetical protein [Solirubrobacteraceae bacterium]
MVSTDDLSTTAGITESGAVVGQTFDPDFKQQGFVFDDNSGLQIAGDEFSGVFGVTPNGNTLLTRRLLGDSSSSDWYLSPSLLVPGIKLDLKPVLFPSRVLGGSFTPLYGPNLASDGTLLGYKGDDPRTFWLRLPNGTQTQITGLVGHNAVNAKHVVAGTITVPDGEGGVIPHAAIRKPDGTVVDLNTLVPASRNLLLLSAMLINDNGDIAGIAANQAGDQVGFLMPAGYIVDSTGDQPDAAVGDGNCLTAQATCTLRAAIQEVNGGTGTSPTSVGFNLPGGATTITPASPLPAITKPIALDGAGNPGGRVLIDGVAAGSGTAGLRIEGDGSRVQNLSIKRFAGPGMRIQASQTLIGGLPDGPTSCASPCVTISDNAGPGIVVAGTGSNGNALRGNRIVANGGPAIDLGADGRTANDAGDSDGGANGLHNFPVAVLGTSEPRSGQRRVAGQSDPRDAGRQVDVYAQPAVTPGRGAEPTDYVGSATITASGGWVVNVPTSIPATTRFFSAAITTSTDGTSELSAICGDPDGDGTPDTDGDGLCDDWERSGIDIDENGTVDLPLHTPTYGANPSHKDLYLEIDAMKDSGLVTYAPQRGAIDAVVDAFARAPVSNPDNRLGITLHVNPGRPTVDDAVDENNAMKGYGRDSGSLLRIRDGSPIEACDGNFGTAADRAEPDCAARLGARNAAFRYALFAFRYAEHPGSSGLAPAIGGSTLTVTLAQWSSAGVLAMGGGVSECLTPDGCRRRVDAATLMHEFGHLVGLRHGGNEDLNYKPNYLSIMNYLYQFQDAVHGRPLDYARYELPSLSEEALVDAEGVLAGVDAASRAEIAGWWPQVAWHSSQVGCTQLVAATDGPVDWDTDPETGAASAVIRPDAGCGGAPARLTAPQDWPNLQYSFREGMGLPESSGAGAEAEQTDVQAIERAARSDRDRNGINDLADSCRIVAGASGFADANANGFADDCEDDMNRLQAFPSQPFGAGGGPGPGPGTGPAKDTTAPTIAGLKAKPSTARRARGKKKAVPAKLSFTVSEASVITFTGERASKGRTAGKRCVAGGKKGKRCTAYKPVKGALRIDARAGAGKLDFAGRLGATKLGAGTYRLTAVAIDPAGNRSAPAAVTVTVR